LFEPYIGAGAKIIVDPARNVLVVSGSAPARQNIIDLIRVFDVDYLAGQSYALFPAKSGDPVRLATDLEAALRLNADSPLTGVVRILPIKEANAIMVIAQQPAYIDGVSLLIAKFDAVKERAGRAIHVYYLKNVQATDLQPILQRAVNPPNNTGAGEIAPGNLPPSAEPAQIAAPANAPTPGLGASANSPLMRTNVTVASPDAPPATLDFDANAQSSGKPDGPQIIADHSTSALIIVATESEYAMIEPAIRKLDILPMQVLIEATVAEVTLNNSLQYGTQFFLRNHEGQATLSNALSPAPIVIDPSHPLSTSQLLPGLLAPSFPGLAIARTVGQEQFLLQALKDITDVQIISAPRLLILDKQQASFQVGELVPTITQSATSVITAGAPVVNSIQYQATGVILNVTPSINSGGLVTLDIEQEVSDVVPTTTSSINSPTFQQRKIRTKVVVQDGETISLAGLISDKKFRGNSGIPFLGTLPVVGALFSTRDNSTARTELLILLTPRVLYDQRDARALTDELRRKLAPGRLVQ
jgi:general secretion pathway protein D